MARQKTQTNNFSIQGVNVNLDADDFRKIKSMTGLKKLHIFSHLNDTQKEAGEKELAIKLGIEPAETFTGNTDGQSDLTS